MNLIKPKKLNKGDTIAIIAPAGAVIPEKISKAISYFEGNGFIVKTGKNLYKSNNCMAGSDEERLEDLHEAFSDSEVKAIVCARGGYGCLRLINKIDYELIKNNPKIFCGYSDITILNAMLLRHANFVTFSGPMAQSDFSSSPVEKYTEDSFYKNLTQNEIVITAENANSYGNLKSAEGVLFGGNLSTITSLCGTNFLPADDFIFFAEDLNEPAYKIDRYFTQLINIKDFKDKVKAVVLGDFLDVDDENYLNHIFKQLSAELNVPVISGYPITHAEKKATIPYGASAKLDNNTLIISDYLDE